MTLININCYKPQKKNNLVSPTQLKINDISVIIPVKDNQKGIDLFIRKFLESHSEVNYPKEIIIVDNNSNIKIELKNEYPFPIKVICCLKTGPACARNLGIKNATGDWILFTDSDCIPSSTFLTGYLNSLNGSIGYAGNIKAFGNDKISKYYESQEILLPLNIFEKKDFLGPDFLITANALVWKKALELIGGFNDNIRIAAGEDIDLGFRLAEIGKLSFAFESIVYHNFNGGLRGFIERFKRYGKGNRIISELYSIDLKPRKFKPNNPSLLNYFLAYLQYICLLKGYSININ